MNCFGALSLGTGLYGLTGAVLFLLGLRYADRLEQAVLRRLRRRRKTSVME